MNKKHIYFASDFHLGSPNLQASRVREKKVVSWLESIADNASHIYLVGDVFDFWFEYKHVVPKGFTRLLGCLATLSDKGIKITAFKGNHDMWMFGYFEEELGIPVISDELIVEHYGKKFYIAHGDGVGPGDKKYKLLKEKGISEKAINDSLSVTNKTELFSWNEEDNAIQSFSTLDSLEYYSKFLNAGMLSLDPTSGEILAYVGGIDYRFFQFDHVSQSKRQVGSTFKPIVYTAAIENGMPPCSHIPIKAVTYTDVNNWTPTNSGEVSEDDENLNYSLEKALSNSVNTVAVKVLYETGIEEVIDQAHKMGINSKIEKVPSIALGSANLSMMELAKAYTSYVNQSKPSNPIFITRIEDKNGNVIASFEDLNPKRKDEKAFSDATRQVMLEFMKATVNSGTASRLRSSYQLQNDIAGKTGTTQDNKDGWFVGITPKLVTLTWVGNDNQQIGFSSTRIGQGANSALPIFAKYLQKLNENSEYNSITNARFEKPSESVLQSLDCELTKTDGFFKRLLGSKKDKKTFEKKEKKKGIFSWLKKKDKD